MKRILYFCSYCIFFISFSSLVGLSQDKIKDRTLGGNTTSPQDGALLELESTNRALLLTRVNLTSTTSWGLNGSKPTEGGYAVYNTNVDITGSSNYPIIEGGVGLYYWDGTGWVALKQSYVEPWNVQGTTNRSTLNTENIYQTGSVGVGTNQVYTGAKLQVVGAARFGSNPSGDVGSGSIGYGHNTEASGAYSLAGGSGTKATGWSSLAIGQSTEATATNAIAGGNASKATGAASIAIGQETTASAINSTALGTETIASKDNSFAVGHQTQATGVRSFATGSNSVASGHSSFTAGYLTKAEATNSFAIGVSTTASQNNAFASGNGSTASGTSAAAFGTSTVASGHSSLAMGNSITASGSNSFAGGNESTAGGSNAFAFGNKATTTYSNTMVVGVDIASERSNEFVARFSAGYRLYTSSSGTTTGVILGAGANAWSTPSSRLLKENFKAVDVQEVLAKVRGLELTSWNYIGQDQTKFRHYGPMAEDFYAAFGNDGVGVVGQDDSINQADFDGVNLMAIQALAKENDELKARIERLEKLLLDKK